MKSKYYLMMAWLVVFAFPGAQCALGDQPFEGQWSVNRAITGDSTGIFLAKLDMESPATLLIQSVGGRVSVKVTSVTGNSYENGDGAVSNVRLNGNEMSFVVYYSDSDHESSTMYYVRLVGENRIEGMWKKVFSQNMSGGASRSVLTGTLQGRKLKNENSTRDNSSDFTGVDGGTSKPSSGYKEGQQTRRRNTYSCEDECRKQDRACRKACSFGNQLDTRCESACQRVDEQCRAGCMGR